MISTKYYIIVTIAVTQTPLYNDVLTHIFLLGQ